MPVLMLPTLENNIEMAESSSESEFEADFSEEEFTNSDDQYIKKIKLDRYFRTCTSQRPKAATVTTEVEFQEFIAADQKI